MTSPGQYRSGQKRWQKVCTGERRDSETKSSAIAGKNNSWQLLQGKTRVATIAGKTTVGNNYREKQGLQQLQGKTTVATSWKKN